MIGKPLEPEVLVVKPFWVFRSIAVLVAVGWLLNWCDLVFRRCNNAGGLLLMLWLRCSLATRPAMPALHASVLFRNQSLLRPPLLALRG